MEAKIADTVIGLEMKVGQTFADLPEGAKAQLYTRAIDSLAGQLAQEIRQALEEKVELPFARGISVELLNVNSVEGQNLLDENNIQLKEEPQ